MVEKMKFKKITIVNNFQLDIEDVIDIVRNVERNATASHNGDEWLLNVIPVKSWVSKLKCGGLHLKITI